MRKPTFLRTQDRWQVTMRHKPQVLVMSLNVRFDVYYWMVGFMFCNFNYELLVYKN